MPEDDETEEGVTERTSLLRSPVANTAEETHNYEEEEQSVAIAEVSSIRLALILCPVWIGVFLGAMDETIIATLAAPISSEFDSLYLLSWFATAYLVSSSACLPITGRLTDIFGRGPGLVLSNILFATGNLICGLATSPSLLLLGRVIAGIGGAGIRSIANFLASDLVPLRKRGVTQAAANVFYGTGAMLGGVVGGLLSDLTSLGWRLAFLIQVPPILASALAVFLLVKIPPKQSDKSYLARIDFLGVFLATSFIVLFLLGLNSAGNIVPWIHPLPLVTIPLSLLLLATFIAWEVHAPQPIIPVTILLERTILSASLTNFFSDMLLKAAIFYIPLYLQARGASATSAGWGILPSPVGDMIGALGAGYAIKRTGKYVRLGVPGMMVLTIGTALFTLQDEATSAWVTGTAFFLVGFGYGVMLTTTQVACLASVEHSQQAMAMSAVYFIRAIGSTIGISAASAVYQSLLHERLWQRFATYPEAAEVIDRLLDSLSELEQLPVGWYGGVMKSFMEAFQGVWQMIVCWAVVALLSIAVLKQHQL